MKAFINWLLSIFKSKQNGDFRQPPVAVKKVPIDQTEKKDSLPEFEPPEYNTASPWAIIKFTESQPPYFMTPNIKDLETSNLTDIIACDKKEIV